MSFVYPQFLWAFLALSIPIIIHLFHFRRFRNVFFSNVEFLKQIKTEKKTRHKIKNLIVLLLRLLALSALILAFAQPYRISSDMRTSGINMVSIYIDNSPSMQNTGYESSLFEEAKSLAIELIFSMNENDMIQVISNSMSVSEQRFYNREISVERVEQLELSNKSRNLSSILNSINSSLGGQTAANKKAFIISDFQKNITDVEAFVQDTLINYIFIPIAAMSYDNISIDSAWFFSPFISPGQESELIARISNRSGNELSELTLRLNLNQVQKLLTFDLSPFSTVEVKIPFMLTKAGWYKGVLSLDDYPVSFDDEYFISFNVADRAEVMIINAAKDLSALRTVFLTDPYFRVTQLEADQIDLSLFKTQQLIILNELASFSSGLISEIGLYVRNGGKILIIPPSSDRFDEQSYRDLMSALGISPFTTVIEGQLNVGNLDQHSYLLSGVFEKMPRNLNLPVVKKYYMRQGRKESLELKLLSLDNKESFFTSAKVGKGYVFTSSVPLNKEWSNFQHHALFVPLIYQLSLYQTNISPLSYIAGISNFIELDPKHYEGRGVLNIEYGEESFIPESRISGGSTMILMDEQFNKAGFYNIMLNDDASKNPVIAVNPTPDESDLAAYTPKELKQILPYNISLLQFRTGSIRDEIQMFTKGKPLWRKLIWLVLFFLLLEVVIIRIIKL